LDIDWRIILNGSYKNRIERRMDLSGSEQIPVTGSCELGKGPPVSMKFFEFLEWFSNC
jgi:hypothetical protein